MREKGAAAFDAYYRALFGNDWDILKSLLLIAPKPAFLMQSGMNDRVRALWKQAGLPMKFVKGIDDVIEWPEGTEHGTILPGVTEGLLYPLSVSSLFPVKALDIMPGQLVLDACAAPGGKTLAIANRLQTGKIIANDLSPDRLKRLKSVIKQFGVENMVEFRQQPAEILARRIDMEFDRILVDAPCSSEAHVVKSPQHLAQWSYRRIEELHKRQVNMVTALLQLLKPDGRLVYSTCALTPEEDENVVSEVLSKAAGFTNIKMQKFRPDIDGFEPMFVAVFERK